MIMMNEQIIESILLKHDIKPSEYLTAAIAEIIRVTATDHRFIDTIQKQLNHKALMANRARGIL